MSKKMKCPRCRSHNIEVMGGGRKNVSIGKSLIGGALTGGAGFILGGLMGKKGKYEVFCKDCGHRWKMK